MSKKNKPINKQAKQANKAANAAPQVEAPIVETKKEEKVEEPKVEEVQTPSNTMSEFTEQVK